MAANFQLSNNGGNGRSVQQPAYSAASTNRAIKPIMHKPEKVLVSRPAQGTGGNGNVHEQELESLIPLEDKNDGETLTDF